MIRARSLASLLLVALLAGCGEPPAAALQAGRDTASPARPLADSTFAALVQRLSGPGGYFDTDNLITNESSYLHPLSVLDELGVRGGAYIGVGPDQNFSYMARIRPRVAFIIDIRRDNLLQHLWMKALFAGADSRIGYLAAMFGRDAPDGDWSGRSIGDLVAYIDGQPADSGRAAAIVDRTAAAAAGFGVPLSESDLSTIRRFHRTFIEAGLDLRFSSYGRRPQPYYPDYRRLLLATDLAGRPGHYLAREDDFLFIKEMQRRNLVIPVVGDLAGRHALREIGRVVREMGEPVSALYTSNVEFYLMRSGTFDRYARTVAGLPMVGHSVILRSYFNRMRPHPERVDGHLSTQLVQRMEDFATTVERGGYGSYWELVAR